MKLGCIIALTVIAAGLCRASVERTHAPDFTSKTKVLNPNLISQVDDQSPLRRYHLSMPAQILKQLALNYDMAVADFFWLRFVQGHDILVIDRKQKGWLYQLLNAMVTLDSRFRIAYISGGTWLSVIRQDVEGATDILERGIQAFPLDWRLHLQLLYHHLYETKDRTRAEQVAINASKLPEAPPFVARLVSTLMEKRGDLDGAILFLQNMIRTTDDPRLRVAYEEKLKRLLEKEK